jgi:hypothetical protein
LFYALSQAGRALAAARCENWAVGAHGISEDRSVSHDDPLLRQVKRRASADDAFSALCAALSAPDPFGTARRPIEIGAAWAALPELNRYMPSWVERWWPALEAYNTAAGTQYHTMELRIISRAPQPLDILSAEAYPSLPEGYTFEPAAYRDVPMDPTTVRLGAVTWERSDTTPSVFDLTHARSQSLDRWLLPAPPGSDAPFVPLTAWWVLLFGLSIFARYHPGLWSSALNLDGSERALPLRLLLDDSLNVVPGLIAEALIEETRSA